MMCRTAARSLKIGVLVLFATSLLSPQVAPVGAPNATTESIGDVIEAEDALHESRPIHIIYVHGINQVGAGDSLLLRKSICKYLQECTETHLGRVYADKGPFALGQSPPRIGYM